MWEKVQLSVEVEIRVARELGASGGDVGSGVGSGVGAEVALAVGSRVGLAVGSALGCDVGSGVGFTYTLCSYSCGGARVSSPGQVQKCARLYTPKMPRLQVQRLALLPAPAWWAQVTGLAQIQACVLPQVRSAVGSAVIGSAGASAVE